MQKRMPGIRAMQRREFDMMFLLSNLFAKLFEQINIPGLLWVIIEKFF